MKQDTIAAISTGISNSGIAIIRLSGDIAFDIISKMYKGSKDITLINSHTINYGHIVDEKNTIIDQVLVSIMRKPYTFTGEDIVEINCHGGAFVANKILEIVLSKGARLAEPGEYTKRAFLNGKMDLSQAEAVIDVINAENNYALQSSISQLKGSLKKKIKHLREVIIYEMAFIETALDDPEHYSLEGYPQQLLVKVENLIDELSSIILSADDGRIIKDGIKTVIVGKPNAGKSSLLNVLSGYERAIVTDIAGTTRDILEERINLGELTLQVIDTAGIRDTVDVIEKIGVDKALEYVENADLIIYVVDASVALDENDKKIIERIYDKKVVVLLNKSDLDMIVAKEDIQNYFNQVALSSGKIVPTLDISAKNEEGIEELTNLLKKMFLSGDIAFNNQVVITNLRQKVALESARDFLLHVVDSIQAAMPEDFYSIDLMNAYEQLGNITGEVVGEDLINEIFNKFCVGK